jgi:hypothetical protein
MGQGHRVSRNSTGLPAAYNILFVLRDFFFLERIIEMRSEFWRGGKMEERSRDEVFEVTSPASGAAKVRLDLR